MYTFETFEGTNRSKHVCFANRCLIANERWFPFGGILSWRIVRKFVNEFATFASSSDANSANQFVRLLKVFDFIS
ncbi:MAG: hypothetical protein ACEY26_01000 [Candidatus Hodgkinia cicadicola]